MKTYLLPLLAAFALTIGTAAAQTTAQTAPALGKMEDRGHGRRQANPEQMAKHQSERMTKELGLNAEQTPKVQQILLARGQEMQTLRGQGRDGGNRDQMREQLKANRAKYDEQFKAVLTADQYTKYTAMQAEPKKHGRDHGMEGGKMKSKTKDGDKVKIKKAEM